MLLIIQSATFAEALSIRSMDEMGSRFMVNRSISDICEQVNSFMGEIWSKVTNSKLSSYTEII